MQPNLINISVDTLNDGTVVVPETYERSDEFQNRSVYSGPDHTLLARDTISLYRSYPTKNGNFNGVAKTAVKLSKDHSVPGVDGVSTLTSPVIIEVSFSIPVGVTEADVVEARQRAIALLDLDAVMTPLNSKLLV